MRTALILIQAGIISLIAVIGAHSENAGADYPRDPGTIEITEIGK